ncbi:AAA family ATPase [Jeotgalibaca sp. MA1X17-3]|uniref:ATP-dependent Clp protease ATP-binding subunit n=1 Tax=Jeotgalibaca sp. MA1X17-3 TaxID=2908211 RepID=UPI001F334867|nr:ATP-dependent Clp protease ATP-binding subunit [Jeotgalibaca sp. MA1X17-3]UJF15146.1 AAA family ATPase [Jeotgalibaca sp. MA1X17-3]
MKCINCGKNEASIHLYASMNGKTQKIDLCQNCYQQWKAMQSKDHSHTFFNLSPGNPSFNFNDFENRMRQYQEEQLKSQSNQPSSQATSSGKGGNNGGELLNKYGVNLTELARQGAIDPVIGRDSEITRIIEILNRRSKNNPVLTGEAGVGKTAVVEGLAQKIVDGEVPHKLLDKEVIRLDVVSLVQGTGIRGQFEERMQQLMDEVRENKQIILFIDEIHEIVGAGSAEGSMDAGNILKPALARGEIQLIGATTLNEYRKIEKDAALERRFQPVRVSEPTPEQTLIILKGIRPKYEDYHKVSYSDKALEAAVNLSHRYIQDRYLPDKAIDLLDESGSKKNLTMKIVDPKEIDERMAVAETEKQAALHAEDYEKAAYYRDQISNLKKMKENPQNLDQELTVTHQDIQKIVEVKTNIPVGDLLEKENEQLRNLDKDLKQHVIGQDEAVDKVAKAIRRNRIGFGRKNRPIGSFLFVGPTGVGKTELAKQLANEMFGTEDSIIRFDMSEYMEKHAVSKLIGSPPGYVGYDEAGQLTEQVRRNPYSIVLLDEIEKAHPDAMHLFLQILEDGRLTDSQGRTVSFKDTVIIMTSNAGTGTKEANVGFGAALSGKTNSVLDRLNNYFKPEFINRFDAIVEFNSLSKENLFSILTLMLEELNNVLVDKEIHITVNDATKEKLIDLGYSTTMGVRPLRRIIQEQIEDQVADYYLDDPHTKNINFDVDDNGSIIIDERVTQPIEKKV